MDDDRVSDAINAALKLVGKSSREADLKSFLRGENINPEKTAWCAAFMNSVFRKAGIDPPKSQLATYYLNWGRKVERSDLQPGDVAVFGRDSHNKWGKPRFGAIGHAAIVQDVRPDGSVLVISGDAGHTRDGTTYVMHEDLPANNAALGAAEFRRAPSVAAPHAGRIRVMTRMIVK